MKRLLIILILLAAGIGFLLIGFHELSNGLELTKNGLRTKGTVIDIKKQGSGKKSTYLPEIKFTTDTGQTVIYTYSTGSNPPAYSIAQSINIIYMKDDPVNFIIDSKSAFIFPVIFILSGGLFALCAVVVIIKRKQE